jgi:hypothetical protein
VELWTEAEELATDELLAGVELVAGVVFVFGLGFGGGACRAGTAPALVKGVMLACWAPAALEGAREPV